MQRLPVQGHILNIGGDALMLTTPNFSRLVCVCIQIKVISVHYNGYGINVNGTSKVLAQLVVLFVNIVNFPSQFLRLKIKVSQSKMNKYIQLECNV
jgi:hypothetical protein